MTVARPATIFSMCKLYSEASIESDMGKRIMLSIIPAVQSEGEKYHTGGFDYKALRSAAHGAKDIVKYGSKACIDELKHAHVDVNDYNTTQERHSNQELQDRASRLRQEAGEHWLSGNYIRCLDKCVLLFNAPKLWLPDYGGEAWEKIAKVLLDIATKDRELAALRTVANSPNRDDQIDYVSNEVSIMKELVVLLNVFDGLAHNSASIMYNVVEEELKALKYPGGGVHNPFDKEGELIRLLNKQKELEAVRTKKDDKFEPTVEIDKHLAHIKKLITALNNEKYPARYMKQILTLMDAKELSNPFDVYRQIGSIIEQGDTKHLFKDYIQRIKSDQKFNEASAIPADEQLKKIRLKKQFLIYYEKFQQHIADILYRKERVMKALRHQNLEYGVAVELQNAMIDIRYIAENISSYMASVDATMSVSFPEMKSSDKKIDHLHANIINARQIVITLANTCNNVKAKIMKARLERGDLAPMSSISEVDLMNDIHRLKQAVAGVEGMMRDL